MKGKKIGGLVRFPVQILSYLVKREENRGEAAGLLSSTNIDNLVKREGKRVAWFAFQYKYCLILLKEKKIGGLFSKPIIITLFFRLKKLLILFLLDGLPYLHINIF